MRCISIEGRMYRGPPYNLKAPASTPARQVEHATVSTMQETYQAGTAAGGSDRSWIQAQSADLSGMTFSGITTTDRTRTTRGASRRNSCQRRQDHLPHSHPRAGPPPHWALHRALGAPAVYKLGSKVQEWVLSFTKTCKRHRRLHLHVLLQGNLPPPTRSLPGEPRASW
eukprot:1246618-Pyramimonas_sp.AAC.1